MFDKTRVESWLTKAQKEMIEQVDEDSEVVEVVLKEGFINEPEQETVWVMGKFRHESGDMTLNAIREDMKDWLSHVAPVDQSS